VRTGGSLRDLDGQRIYFSIRLGPRQKAPAGSSTISAAGLIAAVPRAPAPESFDGYLSGLGVNFRLSRGRMIAQQEGPTAYRRFCENLALQMNALLGAGIERKPALAAVYRAMMLGRRRGLSFGQRRLFLRGGSMHLFAINGLHIGVVAISMNALLGLLRCPKPLAGSLVLAVLWLDVDTTGASPSAVRAFLMVASMEAAWVLRKPGNPLAALAASALVVALIRPMDFFSASFQMSYAVVTGIMALGLPLGSRLGARLLRTCDEVPRETWRLRHRAISAAAHTAVPAFAVCTSAALVSAVTGVEFFGLLAPVGLLVNLVLAPLASLVIVAGFSSIVAGLSGAIAAARIFNLAAAVLLSSIHSILAWATAAPGAWLPAHTRATWVGPAALALLVASCLFGYGSGWRRERGGFWPPFAIVALTLLAGVKFG
jgi:competence protein ComEC